MRACEYKLVDVAVPQSPRYCRDLEIRSHTALWSCSAPEHPNDEQQVVTIFTDQRVRLTLLVNSSLNIYFKINYRPNYSAICK